MEIPANRGMRYSVILCALGPIRGILDFVIVTGPTKADCVFMFHMRLTKIGAQSVILDNAANHKANNVKETQGITSPMYLPPYSPGLAPTELFSRVFKAKFHFTGYVMRITGRR